MLNTNSLSSIVINFIKPIFNAFALIFVLSFLIISQEAHAKIKAGVAKLDITDRTAGLVNDPLYVKALVLENGLTKMVIITLDVVALEEIGPIDPEIGIFRLNKLNGETLAVLYNFAVHPIKGVPNGGNTADIIGFASRVIEDN